MHSQKHRGSCSCRCWLWEQEQPRCRADGEKPEKAWEHADKYQRAFIRGILNGAVDFVTGIIEIPQLAVDAGYGLSDTGKAAGKWLEDYKGDPADLMGELADRAVELQKAAFQKAEDLGTVTKEKLSNMKTEDWFEAGGYATSVIASFFLGGAGAAGEAADTANAAGKTAEAINTAGKTEKVLNGIDKVGEAEKAAEAVNVAAKAEETANVAGKAEEALKEGEKTGKVLSGIERVREAEKANEVVNVADKAEEAVNIAGKTEEAVKEAGKTEKVLSGIDRVREAEKASEAANVAAKAEEATNVAGKTEEVVKKASKTEKVLSGIDQVGNAGKAVGKTTGAATSTEKADTVLNGVAKDKVVAGNVDKAGGVVKDAGTTGKELSGVGNGNAIKGGLNSYEEFNSALKNITTRTDLSNEEKISKLHELFKNSNYKTDINVPSDVQYIKDFDTSGNVIYDWPPKLGFDENTITSISRNNGLPEGWDRYGYMGGSNFADIPISGKYSYSERAIPYVENEAAYHKGIFNSETYFDKIDAIKNNNIDELNSILKHEGIDEVEASYFRNLKNTYNDFIEDTTDAIGSTIDATYGLKGKVASWGDMTGGARQFVTPLNGTSMSRLGIIK